MKEKDIQRINELYNLDKSIGLTPEQKEEQRKLRHEYIQSVRANLRAQLNNVSIKNEDGKASRNDNSLNTLEYLCCIVIIKLL